MLSSPYRYAPKSRSSFQVSRVGACGTCSLSIDERGDFVDLLGLKFIPSTLYGQDFPPMTQKQANNSRRRSFSLMGHMQACYLPSLHSSAVKRWATLLLRTAMLMARVLPASTHSLRARVMAVYSRLRCSMV